MPTSLIVHFAPHTILGPTVAMGHSSTARDVNSVPLSVVMTRGDACVFARRSSTVTTRFPVVEDHTSIAGLAWLK
jgi:hypothetical protein